MTRNVEESIEKYWDYLPGDLTGNPDSALETILKMLFYLQEKTE